MIDWPFSTVLMVFAKRLGTDRGLKCRFGLPHFQFSLLAVPQHQFLMLLQLEGSFQSIFSLDLSESATFDGTFSQALFCQKSDSILPIRKYSKAFELWFEEPLSVNFTYTHFIPVFQSVGFFALKLRHPIDFRLHFSTSNMLSMIVGSIYQTERGYFQNWTWSTACPYHCLRNC